MSYVTQSRIQTVIPAPHLNDALDDDRDGMADSGVLDEIIAAASQAVDALLAPRYAVPFEDPAPALVAEGAFIFACELIYDRRQITDKNPFKERADKLRTRLDGIGKGEGELDAALPHAVIPGAAITEDVSVNDTMR